MTKPWDLHEATIKKLYAENTLAVVRRTMIEKHNFTASTRAYRGRLIRWGVRKYSCRRRSHSGSISSSSQEGSTRGESDKSSPTWPQDVMESDHEDLSLNKRARQVKDVEPNPLARLFHTMETDNWRDYAERNRNVIPPPLEMQFDFSVSPMQSPTTFSHATQQMTTAPYFGFPPLSPAMNTYTTTTYEPGEVDLYRRQSFPPMPGRPDGTMDYASPYALMRDYGQG